MNTMTIQTSFDHLRRMREMLGWAIFASGTAFLIERAITALA